MNETKKPKVFPKGIFFKKPQEGAPKFIRGNLSFKVSDAIEFLKANENEKGYVNIDMLNSDTKGIYLVLNDWQAPQKLTEEKNDVINYDDM